MSRHPRNSQVVEVLKQLRAQEQEIRQQLTSNNPGTLASLSSLTRRAVELFTIAQGASAIKAGSLASRLNQDVMLFDVVIQSPKTIEAKLREISRISQV